MSAQGIHAQGTERTETDWPDRGAAWLRVSPKYAWADLVMNLLSTVLVAVVVILVWIFADEGPPLLVLLIAAAVVLALLANAVFAFRRVRAIGYILREDDLLFRRGVLFEPVIGRPRRVQGGLVEAPRRLRVFIGPGPREPRVYGRPGAAVRVGTRV